MKHKIVLTGKTMLYGKDADVLLDEFIKSYEIAKRMTGIPEKVFSEMAYIIVNYHPRYRKYIGYCEECEHQTLDEINKFCPKCGTKLTW